MRHDALLGLEMTKIRCIAWAGNHGGLALSMQSCERKHTIYLRKSDVRKCNIYLGKLCAQMNSFTWENCVRK